MDTSPVKLEASAKVGADLTDSVNKLTRTVAGYLSSLWKPRAVRKMADAKLYAAKQEANAAIIVAETNAKIEQIDFDSKEARALRAKHRLLETETRRQENIEAVVEKVEGLLPPQVTSKPVDPDWTAAFFESCKDVSSEQIRTLFAKLLAEEVSAPSSVSLQTLRALQIMTREDAETFQQLSRCICTCGDSVFIPKFPVGPSNLNWMDDAIEITHAQLLHMTALGLVAYQPETRYFLGASPTTFACGTRAIEIQYQAKEPPLGIPVIVVMRAGVELSRVLPSEPSDKFMNHLCDLMNYWGRDYTAQASLRKAAT